MIIWGSHNGQYIQDSTVSKGKEGEEYRKLFDTGFFRETNDIVWKKFFLWNLNGMIIMVVFDVQKLHMPIDSLKKCYYFSIRQFE